MPAGVDGPDVGELGCVVGNDATPYELVRSSRGACEVDGLMIGEAEAGVDEEDGCLLLWPE